MKATKIIGAVLGVLLVAALFTGAAAAAPGDTIDQGDVYAYMLYPATAAFAPAANTTWTDANGNEVTFVVDPNVIGPNVYYIDGSELVEGTYFCANTATSETWKINIKQPTATVSAAVYETAAGVVVPPAIAELIGGTADTDKAVQFTITGGLAGVMSGLMFTGPNDELGDKTFGFVAPNIPAVFIGAAPYPAVFLNGVDLGIWKVQAVFANDGVNFTTLAPAEMYGKEYFFTTIKADTSKKLSTTSDSVIQGNKATVTLTAPFGDWAVIAENGTISATQKGVSAVNPGIPFPVTTLPDPRVYVHVGTSGAASFAVTSTSSNDMKINLYDNDWTVPLADQGRLIKTLNIKVVSGTVTGKVKDDVFSVNIGNEIDLEGTNDLGGTLYFFIRGTNYEFQPIYTQAFAGPVTAVELPALVATTSGKEWDFTLDTGDLRNNIATTQTVAGASVAVANGKRPDAGTYTVYAASLTPGGIARLGTPNNDGWGPVVPPLTAATTTAFTLADLDNGDWCNAYATISVALKQPFITLTNAPEVIVRGESVDIIGTAEGTPAQVQWYIFGTNYFGSSTVGVTDGEFTITLNAAATEEMAAGQYFLVVQHPMYDRNFNIAPLGRDIVLNKNAQVAPALPANIILFNTDNRQSANAAQALCDALDSQDIDDMYVKASFVVAGPTSYIDPVPSQITKGQVLTISGTTTGHNGEIVTVELLSTAFAAIPKETVGSASFIALTTKIGDDGKWTISFDTSNLNADEYTCSIAVGQLDATSSKITIVEGAGPQPTQTGSPVTPTAQPTAQPTATPATPGFGALAALAGLGAVAVLLLRRQ